MFIEYNPVSLSNQYLNHIKILNMLFKNKKTFKESD